MSAIIIINKQLDKIAKIFEPKPIEPPCIQFKKEDLIKLDEIQSRLLFVLDGCQSIGYKTDRDIFLICLEILQVCTLALVGKAAFNVGVTDPNDDRAKDFAFIISFLEEYFPQNLNNKLG